MKLGITIPSYNEGENISKLASTILNHVTDAQILIVDDSKDDSCVKAIQQLNHPQVRILHRNTKGGRGSAVIEGLNQLLSENCTHILEMDADFSHPPQQIPELIQTLNQENADLVIGSRYIKGSQIINWPLSRRLFSYFANILARITLRVPAHDYTNGFRLYSKKAALIIVKTCSNKSKGFISLSEILVNLYYRGCKIIEVPTCFVNRVRGESSLSRHEIADAAKGLIKIYFLVAKIKKNPEL